MTLHQGNTSLSSSQQLPHVRLGHLTRLMRCFRNYRIQGHRQVCRTRLNGPRTLSKTADANLVRLLKTHFFRPIIDLEKSTE